MIWYKYAIFRKNKMSVLKANVNHKLLLARFFSSDLQYTLHMKYISP
jgi:hypothetical protein